MTKTVITRFCLAAVWAAAFSACTTHETAVPDLAGPSEFATSVSLSATPDSIISNGFQQSQIVITVRDVDGSPKRNVQFRLFAAPAVGSFSDTAPFTDGNGQARSVYTPPTASPFTYGAPPATVVVYATPIGSNYQTAVATTVDIQVLTPPVPPSAPGDPVASFSATATAAKVGQVISFDASASAAGTGADIAQYVWDFGDGAANDEHGVDASHVYASSGTYMMTLGIVDTAGRRKGTFKQITVSN